MGVDISQALSAAAGMEAHALTASDRALVITAEYAEAAKGLISARAPRGPHAHDDPGGVAFADSFDVDTGQWRGHPSSEVGTNKPQGFRLELGFHGTDRTGRRISQSPRPTVGPAVDSLAEPFWTALEALPEEV